MSRLISNGQWCIVKDKNQFEKIQEFGYYSFKDRSSTRIQRGHFSGPGNYLLLNYTQRCSRHCCYDYVYELLSYDEVKQEIKEQILELGNILKSGKALKLNSIIKKMGGKSYQQKNILDQIRPSLNKVGSIYCEPFCGGCSVLLNLDLPCKKYAFDIDANLIMVWKVIRDYGKILQEYLLHHVKYKYSKSNFEHNLRYIKHCNEFQIDDEIHYAAAYIFVNRTSRSANMKDWGESTRLRGGQNEYKNAYKNAITNLLPLNNSAIQGVIFDAGDYVELMDKYDLINNNNVTVYADPPYVHETRTSTKLYTHELPTYERDKTPEDASSHEELFKLMARSNNFSFLSGYESAAYAEFEQRYLLPAGKTLTVAFRREIANHACQNKTKSRRLEMLWKV